MIEAVVLAAGLSSRMQQFKLALPLGGRTVLECTILSLYPHCSKIWLVCGKQIEIVAAMVSSYTKIEILLNNEYEQGMFSSIKTGVSHICSDYFFLIPADYPLIKSSTYSALLEYIKTRPEEKIVIPVYNNRKGHPILLKKELVQIITDASVTSTLREIIRNHGGGAMVQVDDPGIERDVDTEMEYEMIKREMVLGKIPEYL